MTHIPLKERFLHLNGLNIKHKNLDHRILSEELHTFNGQYSIAKHLGLIVYTMAKTEHLNNVVDVSNFKTWLNEVHLAVEVDYSNILGNISASITKVGTDDVSIKVSIPFKTLNVEDRQVVINRLSNALVHELMHDNIFIKRYTNGVPNFDDTPDDYPTYIKMMQENDEQSWEYKVGLALYSTFYQETQAIISQTVSNLRLILGKKDCSNDEIAANISKTEGYARFQIILNDIVPSIEKLTDEAAFELIERPIFRKYSITVKPKDLVKKFKFVSQVALRKIVKSAMLMANNITEEKIL